MKLGVQKLKLDYLFVDDTVQRSISQMALNKKIREFDLDAVGVLIVSKRSEKEYHLLDGQHRWLAAKENGIDELECEIHVNLSEKEEAELFLKYNQDRSNTKPIDHFKIEVKAGEETSIIINEILKEYGLSVSRRGIQAPKALKQIYKYYGEYNFRRTIKLINDVWGVEGMKAPMLIGTACFMEIGGAYVQYDKYLSYLKKGPTRIFENIKISAERTRVTHRYNSNEAYCHTLCAIYNKMVKDRDKWVIFDPLVKGICKG